MVNEKQIAKIMLSAFKSILIDWMNEPLVDLIQESLLESVSPVVKIVRHGVTVAINRDDYSYNDIINFILKDMTDDTAIIIDGTNILDWE